MGKVQDHLGKNNMDEDETLDGGDKKYNHNEDNEVACRVIRRIQREKIDNDLCCERVPKDHDDNELDVPLPSMFKTINEFC